MSKPVQTMADRLQADTPRLDEQALRRQGGRRALEITGTLQTTLDPERLIELFSDQVRDLVPHQGLRYRNDDLNIEVRIGTQARHSCTYKLNVGDEPLGRLTFRRTHKFHDVETQVIEKLLCSLLYPLRNALLYQDAVQMAQKDPLTGTCNRAALDEMLRRELSHAERHDSRCALIVLDIDRFKDINDRYGHIIGDCALRAVANTAGSCIRDGDLLFRYGGEEFVVLMRETDLAGARLLAERIRENIQNTPCQCSGANIDLTVSAGVSAYRREDSPLSLFARADQALYRAKQEGRNRVCIAE